jgi:tRNA pseudouridine38-40 synthase
VVEFTVSLRNIKLTVQYDGSDFSGYELQPGKQTVRLALEKALRRLFKVKKTINASRTDSGVHALAQAVSFKLDNSIPTSKIAQALNTSLPESLRIVKAEEKPLKFHARYDAKSKEYEYLIFNDEIMPPQLVRTAWHVRPKLDLEAMKQAIKHIKGEHDFRSFCAARSDDKKFTRKIYEASIRKKQIKMWDGCQLSVVSCKLKGNGFLYKMVRNIVGTLVEVGLGLRKASDIKKIIEAQDRRAAGRTAPAQGLCLVDIHY